MLQLIKKYFTGLSLVVAFHGCSTDIHTNPNNIIKGQFISFWKKMVVTAHHERPEIGIHTILKGENSADEAAVEFYTCNVLF